MQSPEDTVAESTDNTKATNPVDRPSPKRRRPLHTRIAPSGPRRRRPVAEIIHPEQQDTAPAPLSRTDLIGGQVQVGLFPVPASIEFIRAGAACPGGDRRNPHRCAAGHSDCGRIRAGLRGERMDWPWRAEEHAQRCHRKAPSQRTSHNMEARLTGHLGSTCNPLRVLESLSEKPNRLHIGTQKETVEHLLGRHHDVRMICFIKRQCSKLLQSATK